MKKIKTINIDEKTYKDFQIYAIMINKSVSSLIEEYMRNVLKEMKKEKWLWNILTKKIGGKLKTIKKLK